MGARNSDTREGVGVSEAHSSQRETEVEPRTLVEEVYQGFEFHSLLLPRHGLLVLLQWSTDVHASFMSDGEPAYPEYTVWSYANRILYKGGMNRFMRAHGMGTLYVSANEDNADWIHRTYRELPYKELPEPPTSFWTKNDGAVLYSGCFNDGYLDGKGEIRFDGGFMIKGEWVHGILRNGSIYCNNHLLYTGEFDRDKRNGKGEQYENGQLLYSGSFVDDAWTGRGEKYDSFGVFL